MIFSSKTRYPFTTAELGRGLQTDEMSREGRLAFPSALDLWQKETAHPSVPTFSRSIDEALGTDGIHLGSITELFGLPGVGKTQFCLQLCASVQVPKILGGLDAEALFIDTNTNFTLHRFQEILEASMSKCQRLQGNNGEVNIRKHLSKFHYVDAFGVTKFVEALHAIPAFLTSCPDVKLIVIDSICFPFKEGTPERKRTGLLFKEMAALQRIALEKRIAIVITNEMSTRIGLSDGEVVGSLGDAWAHRCNKRIFLSAPLDNSTERVALLIKSNDAAEAVAQFQITSEGIRDIE